MMINTDFSNLAEVPLYLWILLATLLFSQGLWLFLDSRKRNANRWFWGLWGLIQFPTPLLAYLLLHYKTMSKKQLKVLLSLIIIIVIAIVLGVVFNYLK